jgi:hypothetical protein
MQLSQSTHRQSFIDILANDIRQTVNDESLSFHTAATRVLLEWLGYNLEDVNFIDGYDRGVDAWLTTESGIDIFQFKTHEPNTIGTPDLSLFNGEGIRDLERAKILLLQERASNVSNKKLKRLLHEWDSAIRNHRLENSPIAMSITLNLIVLGDNLTEAAQAEFQSFQLSNSSTQFVDDIPVQFHSVFHTVNDIIDARWREENRSWTDLKGRKHERITLHPWNEGDSISDNANAVFYCLAIDLVRAYGALGYQLFEPNVRANIKNSRVNQAIKESILHQRTRREFRFLNNGVTITCDSFTKPRSQQPFTVAHPGIVNGLQTVVALHTAYHLLSDQDKEDFEKNCSVLVRLLTNNAVDDITRVVKATNNQNPMKPRNLVSNNSEQLIYARIFAEELGWFYEAKEGAWDAFENDPKRWRPSLKKPPKDFRATNRRKVRRVDNEELAQTWLAFIGFASEAVNEKKALFDDRFYPLIFTLQTQLHGADYDSALARARNEAVKQSPDASLMLLSYLMRGFAAEMSLSASQNRQDACERLGIDSSSMTKAELDARLNQDNKFLLNQALSGMSLLFTEFVGFVCYRAFGKDLHHIGRKLIANHSIATLATDFATESVKENINTGTFNPCDILAVLWLVYVETVEDLLNSGWGQSYRAAPIKVRFIFSRETRERFYREIQNTNEFMKKRSLKKPWAIGVSENQGLFEFIKACVLGYL